MSEMSMKANPKVGVVGSGSFGTAIVKVLTENVKEINWWVRSRQVKEAIETEHRNPHQLSSVAFKPGQLKPTNDINELVKKSDIIFILVPSIYLLDALKNLTTSLKSKIIITGIKGLIPQESKIIGDYFHEDMHIPYDQIGVIAGPCHAEEIALEKLSFLTVAFQEEHKAKLVSELLKGKYMNTTLSDDIIGSEHSAVLKNTYAIAAGIAHGLGYGDNFIAVLLSNAIREMECYLDIIDPRERNINDSVYLGDLLVTGYSYFSRNRMFGTMVGKGYTVKSALMEMNMVPEGYYATDGIHKIAKENDIELPIVRTVYKILYENKNPMKQFKKLSNIIN